MRTIINAEQLRILLNDTRKIMAEQPWLKATDDHSEAVTIPHGKMEALHRLECNDWVFVPVVQTKTKKGGRLVEHGFEVHRREEGWEVITAALEIDGDKSARVHPEPARAHAVQQELEKMRVRVSKERRMEPAGA
jgi:hypothetical protein